MRIRSFWAEGFRSLRDVRLPELGAFNVFYGTNGAGKSNILAAIELLARAAGRRIPGYLSLEDPVHEDWVGELARADDFCHSAPDPRIRLGMTVAASGDAPVFRSGIHTDTELTLEAVFERLPGRRTSLRITRLIGPHCGNLLQLWEQQNSSNPGLRQVKDDLGRFFSSVVAEQLFRLVPAVRAVQSESGPLGTKHKSGLADLFEKGRIKEAFVYALTSPDPVIRDRFARLRELLTGEPLHRPPFDPVYDPQTERYELRERAPGGRDVPLDLAGLGIQQIYMILGQIMLGRASAVGIEEPEAHLHAPTSGRHLRVLLKRLVERGDIEQLFITTHSNLFDLDSTGYFDVRLEGGATVVERKTNLNEIDERHLYEPGPAKHGLEDLLRLIDPSAPVLRRPDGSPVSAGEMLKLLQEDAPEAVEFLREVHGAAVRAVQLRAARKS